MFHINHTDFLSIHAKVSAIKSLKRTCPASDPVTPLCSKRIFQPTCTNAFQELKMSITVTQILQLKVVLFQKYLYFEKYIIKSNHRRCSIQKLFFKNTSVGAFFK